MDILFKFQKCFFEFFIYSFTKYKILYNLFHLEYNTSGYYRLTLNLFKSVFVLLNNSLDQILKYKETVRKFSILKELKYTQNAT